MERRRIRATEPSTGEEELYHRHHRKHRQSFIRTKCCIMTETVCTSHGIRYYYAQHITQAVRKSGRILSHPSLSRHDSEVCYVCRHMLLKETYSFALVENRTHGPSNNCAVFFKIYAGPVNTPPTETRTGEPLGAKPLSWTGTHTATLPEGHKCTSSDCRRSTSFQLLNAESDSSFSRLVSFELRITHRWPCYTEQWSVSQ